MTITSNNSKKTPVELISELSFSFWQSKDFKTLVKFEKISQTEQDRIFNELLLTGLGLLRLYRVQTRRKEIEEETVDQFLDMYKKLGIGKAFIKQWEGLISMRFKEYSEHYPYALESSKDWKEFKNNIKLQRTWTRVETLSIDGWTHIRAGKTDEKDPLWRLVRKWLVMLDAQLIHTLNLVELQVSLKEN